MKKNKFYIYLDQPANISQIEKAIPMNFNLKNFEVNFISSEKLNYSKTSIKNYFKYTPQLDITKKITKFENLSEFENFLKKIGKHDFVFIRERSTTKHMYKSFDIDLFKKYKINTIFFDNYPYVKSNFSKSFFLNVARSIKKFLNDFIELIFYKSYKSLYLIGSGEIIKNKFKKKYHKNYLDFPSMWIDFDQKYKKENIITYVDENIYHSKDLLLSGKKFNKSLHIDSFLKDLNKIFEILEKKTGYKVIISCSKKYFKYNKSLFNNRKIFYGKTLELIAKSKLVLGHRSDAMFQALYNKVPVICLKHKSFNLRRNILIEMRSVNLFNKNSFFIEDYILGKAFFSMNIDKSYYKKVLINHFISNNLKYENFSSKAKKIFDNLNYE